MKAKLVLWSPVTRVIVPDDATEEEIMKAAKDKFFEKLRDEYLENIEDVIDDEECPYDPEHDNT